VILSRNIETQRTRPVCPDFDKEEALACVEEDWQDDLSRHNKGGDCLNHQQFSDALFELVDVSVFPSCTRSIVAEIYLCRACSCLEILSLEMHRQVWVDAPRQVVVSMLVYVEFLRVLFMNVTQLFRPKRSDLTRVHQVSIYDAVHFD
jgi:hypothetical protein